MYPYPATAAAVKREGVHQTHKRKVKWEGGKVHRTRSYPLADFDIAQYGICNSQYGKTATVGVYEEFSELPRLTYSK
jgi:hypothetical protein